MARVVIVGAGVCGIEAALALRAREPDTEVAIVTDEHDHFFSRPALMYVFSGQMTLRDTEPYDRGLFARLRFERIRGRVTALDAGRRQLALEGGGSVGYDRLLLAVGSKARPGPWPGADGPGVHSFVTLRDLEGLDARRAAGRPRGGDRRRLDRGGSGGDPRPPRPPRHLRDPGVVVLPHGPRGARGGAGRRAPPRARHRRPAGGAGAGGGARHGRLPARGAGGGRGDPVRPRGDRHRRDPEHRVPGGQRDPARAERGDRSGRRAAHERRPACGRRGIART